MLSGMRTPVHTDTGAGSGTVADADTDPVTDADTVTGAVGAGLCLRAGHTEAAARQGGRAMQCDGTVAAGCGYGAIRVFISSTSWRVLTFAGGFVLLQT